MTSQSTSASAAPFLSAAKRPFSRYIQSSLRRKAVRRRVVRTGLVAFNLVLLAVVAGIFVVAPRNTHSRAAIASTVSAAGASQATASGALDQLSSANIALTVARLGNLPETTAITNQADSEDVALSETSTANSTVSSKPQVVASAFKSAQDIQTYVTVGGDTISSVAAKFGVTSDSIRWSNNLSGDAVAAGTKLIVPPVNGIVYVVQAGDTADTIAAKFSADKNKMIAFNDAEIGGFKVGQQILVPDGTKAAVVAKSAASSRGSAALAWGGIATYGGYNGYDYGYCTYWVAKLRAAAGNPVPTNLGNAATWAIRAAAYGLPTGTTPRVGAAVVTKTSGAGHVAYVTAVDSAAGTITISEMNHDGWNQIDTRIIAADSSFRYIY